MTRAELKALSPDQLRAALKQHVDAAYEICRELDRRIGEPLPRKEVDYEKYVTD